MWRMASSSLSKRLSLLKLASSLLQQHKYLLPASPSTATGGYASTSLSLLPLSSLFALDTEWQNVLLCGHGAWSQTSSICLHKIWELKCWVLNLLPPVFHSSLLVFLRIFMTLENQKCSAVAARNRSWHHLTSNVQNTYTAETPKL